MKLTKAKCKITGIQLGEAELNLIRPERPPLKVKYAMLGEDGATCGYFEKYTDWSDKALEALRVFSEVLEEEALPMLFDQPAEKSADQKPDEPPQF